MTDGLEATRALIQELEDQFALVGLTAPAGAERWTAAQIRLFFESDGEQSPPPAAPVGNRIGVGSQVVFCGLRNETWLNGKQGEVLAVPTDGGRYTVKIMSGVAGHAVTGRAENTAATLRRVAAANLALHSDQIARDQAAAEDGAMIALGSDEAAARAAVFGERLDPAHCFDAAVARVLAAGDEFGVLGLEPRWSGGQTDRIKKAYRRASLSVHPDRNRHPQAISAFRKVYGAFEVLMDAKQQWRLLARLGALRPAELGLYDQIESEEEERFEWWVA